MELLQTVISLGIVAIIWAGSRWLKRCLKRYLQGGASHV